MRRNSRQDTINRLREQQQRASFFDDNFDKMFDSPVKTFAKFGVIAIVLNLLFWGGLIALALFLLAHFGVI